MLQNLYYFLLSFYPDILLNYCIDYKCYSKDTQITAQHHWAHENLFNKASKPHHGVSQLHKIINVFSWGSQAAICRSVIGCWLRASQLEGTTRAHVRGRLLRARPIISLEISNFPNSRSNSIRLQKIPETAHSHQIIKKCCPNNIEGFGVQVWTLKLTRGLHSVG